MKSRRQSSNEQIAERSGIPLVSVNRYMSGKRHITLATLAELAEALDADPGVLLESALVELGDLPGNVVAGNFRKSSDEASTVDDLSRRSVAKKRRNRVEGESEGPST